ncbi:hypothetical protein FSP39_010476 [Pinctada imbricata]|uniref:Uncharacterized protein n=1 Tax=Pinctada imbricata TaxID=66713 RepID=A0AA89C8W3_PINIB|nr:hypothetical protein FSP39_010476 [Pinctada imbricata]
MLSKIPTFILVFILLFDHTEGKPYRAYKPKDVTILRKKVFINYDKSVRPFSDGEFKTEITFNYKMRNINRLDDIEETLTTTGHLEIRWRDKALSWNRTNHKGIMYIYVPQNDVWKPDLVLNNGNSKISELGGSHYYVAILYTGVVMWDPYEVFTTLCSVDMTYFPFDTQTCNIEFTIWSYRGTDVSIDKKSKIIADTSGNGIWRVKSTKSKVRTQRHRYIAKFKIILERKPHFFIFNIILPITVLGLVSTFVFLIPVDSGEKIGFSMTVFLSFAVFLTFISAEIPKNSEHTSVMNVYIVAEVMLSVILLLISSLQVRLYHKADQPLKNYQIAMIKVANFLGCRKAQMQQWNSKMTKADSTGHSIYDNTEKEWSLVVVSHAIDVIAFYIFTIINVLITSVTFIMLGLY